MSHFSRRQFLATTIGLGTAAILPGTSAIAAVPRQLDVTSRILGVNGKAAKVYALLGPNGKPGLDFASGDRFHVKLHNRLGEPTLIHWHGLTPPNASDGVPGMTQPALPAGMSYDYDFVLPRPGTNFMHSHFGLQEQQLMAAPLIIRDPAEAHLDEQEIVIQLHDFTFSDPAEIFASLQKGMAHRMSDSEIAEMQVKQMQMDHLQSGRSTQMQGGQVGQNMPGMAMPNDEPSDGDTADDASGGNMTGMTMSQLMSQNMPGMQMSNMQMQGMQMKAGMDINDVRYDAFLANDRTYDDPEVIAVERGGRLRLRVINAAAASNFMLDLGDLSGELIAVDGMPVQLVSDKQFALAMGQRLDLRLQLPSLAGAWPVIAQLEGDRRRSVVILATKNAMIGKLDFLSDRPTGRFDQLTGHLVSPRTPLPRRVVDRRLSLDLTGDMMRYRWGLVSDGNDPVLRVKQGERVEIEMINRSAMSHPMHLHGHHFQLVAVNGSAVNGPIRDTHLVPAASSATIAFDADNPGRWALHCHNLYHMVAGMMTELVYI